MTTQQKTIIGLTLAAAVGTGVYEVREVAQANEQNQDLRLEQTRLKEQFEQFQRERDEAMNQLAALRAENERLNRNAVELPRLRDEVARLRAAEPQAGQLQTMGAGSNDPFTQTVLALTSKAAELYQHLTQMPDKSIPELRYLTEADWLAAAKDANLQTEVGIRQALAKLRSLAKMRLPMAGALANFTRANGGMLPTDLSQLKPYFKSDPGNTAALDDATVDAIFARYTLLHTGKLSDLPTDAWITVEKAPVDKEYDSRAKFGNGRSTVIGTGKGSSGDPDDKSY